MGRAIAAAASQNSGVNVFGVSRSSEPMAGLDATYMVADRSKPDAIAEVVESKRIDVVVDVLAMTLKESQPLIAALDGCIAQYVMLSSSDVYSNYELLHRKADGEPISSSVTEDSPLRKSRYPYRLSPRRAHDDPNKYFDDYEKITIEEAVQRTSANWTILRLPMVYGPGDKQRRFSWAIRHFLSTDEPFFMPKEWAQFVSTYGYIDNVAEGISITLGNTKAFKAVFNLGEPELVDHATWANRIAKVVEWPGVVEVSDEHPSSVDQIVQAIDTTVPFRISSDKVRRELGFRETVSIETALRRTIEDERKRGR